jgi:hypothetical protein
MPDPTGPRQRTPGQMILAIIVGIISFCVAYYVAFHLGAWLGHRH